MLRGLSRKRFHQAAKTPFISSFKTSFLSDTCFPTERDGPAGLAATRRSPTGVGAALCNLCCRGGWGSAHGHGYFVNLKAQSAASAGCSSLLCEPGCVLDTAGSVVLALAFLRVGCRERQGTDHTLTEPVAAIKQTPGLGGGCFPFLPAAKQKTLYKEKLTETQAAVCWVSSCKWN